MAKQKLDTRLEADVIERLKVHLSSTKSDMSVLISDAIDALEREQNLSESVTERVEKLELATLSLVSQMRDVLPRIVSAEDKSRRAYNLNYIMLGWCDFLLQENPKQLEKWTLRRKELFSELQEREAKIDAINASAVARNEP